MLVLMLFSVWLFTFRSNFIRFKSDILPGTYARVAIYAEAPTVYSSLEKYATAFAFAVPAPFLTAMTITRRYMLIHFCLNSIQFLLNYSQC